MSIDKFKNLFNKVLPGKADDSDLEETKSSEPKNKVSVKLMSVEDILDCKDVSTLTSHLTNNDRNKRHAAVVGLGSLEFSGSIPELLDCVDDEAPEIRAAAKKYLLLLAKPENAQVFVSLLPQINELRKSPKNNHSEFVTAIERFLIEPQNVLNIHDCINASDKFVSHACFSLVLKYKLGDTPKFVLSALQHSDRSIRIKASHLINELNEEEREKALAIAINDAYMPIRRDAFLTLIKTWHNESLIKKMLFDPHFAIREIAVAHLQKQGEDVEHTYLRSLSDEDPLIICSALWGLGHLKVAECKSLVEPYLSHENPKVQKQAQATLSTLKDAPKKFTDTVEWNSTDTHY